MNEKIRELQDQIDRLRRVAISLKVTINIRDATIRDLERELFNERNQVKSIELNTHEIQQLEILDLDLSMEEEESFDPYETGQYKSRPWEKAR